MISRTSNCNQSIVLFLWMVISLSVALSYGLDVDVKGAEYFNNRRVEEQLPVFPEEPDEDKLESWRADARFNVGELYRTEGFFDVNVNVSTKKEAGEKADEEGSYLVTINIKEGKRYTFGEIVLNIPDTATAQAEGRINKDELEVKTDKPYDQTKVMQARRTILRKYGSLGFVRAKVEDEEQVQPDKKTVRVVYNITPGRPVVFDTLVINNTRSGSMDSLPGISSEEILRDLVPYQPGDTVTVGQNDKIIQKLQSTGLYNYVRIEDSLMEDGNSRLILVMEEKVPGHLRTSLYYETVDGPGVMFDFSFQNVYGTMNEIRAGTDFALNKQEFRLGFGSPLPFGFLLRFDNDAEVEWNQSSLAFDKHGLEPGLFEGNFLAINSSRISRSFFYWLRGVSELELQRTVRLINPEADTANTRIIREVGSNLNFINTAFVTFLDQLLNPTRGSKFSLTWGNGGDFWVNDQFNFERHNWLEVNTSYYYPILRQLVGAARLNAGRFFDDGGTNSQRFFLGGPRSVRSYAFHQLCPTQTCEGKGVEPAYYLVSGEARTAVFDFPVFPSQGIWDQLNTLELVPFVDYGYIRDLASGSSRDGLAFGFGLRYPLLQIFNLRLDLAWGHPGGGIFFWTDRHDYLPDGWILDLAQAF